VMISQADGAGRERPPARADRVAVDNVTLAFAALYEALSRDRTDRAEQVIVGTPLRMIAYRVPVSHGVETLHFEIRPKGLPPA